MPTTYLEAIREGLWEEMERDPNVFCIGEDIAEYGGAFKVTAGFLERFFDKRSEREGVSGKQGVASEEAHLIDETGDAFDAIGEGNVEGGAEFRILPFVRQQLLMGRERHHSVADFVGETVSHGFDEAEIGGLDFKALQLLTLGKVFGHQQDRSRQA